MFLKSKILCTFLFLVFLGSVIGNVGDEALRMVSRDVLFNAFALVSVHVFFPTQAYDCALAELDKSVPASTELGSSATFRPLVCLQSAHCSSGLLGSETARISRSYALFDRYVLFPKHISSYHYTYAQIHARNTHKYARTGTLADVLRNREVKVGVLTGYHESSMDDILSLHTEVFQKVSEHYGVPVHVKLVEITEQETPEAAGFDQLNAGNVDSML